MARQLKPQKVGDIGIPGSMGDRVDLFLDRNEMDFFFTLDGEEIREKSYSALYGKAADILRTYVQIDWIPVILVELKDPNQWHKSYIFREGASSYEGEINVTIERFYMGRSKKNWRKVAWETSPERRNAEQMSIYLISSDTSTLTLPFREKRRTFLAYQEELWQGLVYLIQRIRELDLRLLELINSNEGTALISKTGVERMTNLLPKGN